MHLPICMGVRLEGISFDEAKKTVFFSPLPGGYLEGNRLGFFRLHCRPLVHELPVPWPRHVQPPPARIFRSSSTPSATMLASTSAKRFGWLGGALGSGRVAS